jgi:release factor glutamine methyltransferase
MSELDVVTWREMLAQTVESVGNAQEARWLCEHAAGVDGQEFLTAQDEHVTVSMANSLHDMVRRRLMGEPLQYVMKRWAFRHLDVFVDQRVLIPRPETETVVDIALSLATKRLQESSPICVVDLGTGSGVIGLSMAYELPSESAQVWLTDASSDALDVARANIVGVGRKGDCVRVAEGSWWAALPTDLRGKVDIAVCNPPYIAEHDNEVADDVRKWEPHSALFAPNNGMADIEAVARGASEWLSVGGWLVLEIGYQQGDAVREVLSEAHLADIEIRKDLAGRDRIAIARKS